MKILFVISIILLTSCSTTSELLVPYEISKRNLNSYFENRSKPVQKPKEQEVDPSDLQVDYNDRFKPEEKPRNELLNVPIHEVLFEPVFSENNTQSKAQWSLNTGRRFSKHDYLFPTFLHVDLIKKNETKSKIKISVFKQGVLFKSRLSDQQKIWLETLKKEIEKNP